MAFTAINDSSAHFQTTIYTGNGGGSNAITNSGNSNLQPDWLWIKERSSDSANTLFDSSRGVDKQIYSNTTEAQNSASALSSFNTDGFTVGSDGKTNENSQTYVAWQWKGNGGTTSSNSSGSITSTVQVNTTAGFSIVTYTGTQANATVGHGLGVAPDLMIMKCLTSANGWPVFHHRNTDAPETDFIRLNSTNATSDNAGLFNDTLPTSTVFSVGANDENNKSGDTQIAYCFAQKKGFSKISSYIGNGNDDGQFVYTGFKPSFILIRNIEQVKNWYIFDDKRPGINVNDILISPNLNSAEVDGTEKLDILSNGFKLRQNFSHTNSDGFRYIFAAFASSPFVSSAGVPTTAR
jgi:hypothetical protein